tara:strand:- start:8845 stop:9006 length:162 start_codon:yes stop_codon:yes gene_type:complete
MEKLLILGAGGHGRVTYETANLLKIYKEIVFLDDSLKKFPDNIKTFGTPVKEI